jgi:hypothetical protein
MWMGGTIPLGYDVKNRNLVINEEEADRVRLIFRQYLALGCVSKLRADLDQRGIRSKQRALTSGRVQGGCSFGRGALYHLLNNRIYRGEVVHKGITYPGEHEAIVDEELWNAVQARLTTNRTVRRKTRVETSALLTGLILDDRGNIMSPSYSVRRGNRYRYYISSALLRDRRADAGSRARVNADWLEPKPCTTRTLSRRCRPQARAAVSRFWLLLGGQSRGAGSPHHRWLCGDRPGQRRCCRHGQWRGRRCAGRNPGGRGSGRAGFNPAGRNADARRGHAREDQGWRA